MADIYKFEDYRAYCLAYLECSPKKGHGLRRKWAEAIKCHSTFISQFLSGKVDLSLEQAAKLVETLALDRLQGRYFLSMVNLARAGTQILRTHYREEIAELRALSVGIQRKTEANSVADEIAKEIYFTSPLHQLVHLALYIPGLNTAASVAGYLNTTTKEVDSVLVTLMSLGIVQKDGFVFKPASSNFFFHMPSSHTYRKRFMSQMRLLALESIKKDHQELLPMHYSANLVMSKSDAIKISQILRQQLNEIQTITVNSREEDLFCLNIDLFKAET